MDELDTLIESYSDLSRLYILGATIEERDIPVIQISQGVREVRKYIGRAFYVQLPSCTFQLAYMKTT